MAVVAKVGFHLRPYPYPCPSPNTFPLLHTQNPPCHFRCRPIFISNHRFALILPPWPLHQIPRSRQWDSNAESYNTNNFRSDEGEDFDDDFEHWAEALDDYIDSIWIFKVFGSYGWMLPVILSSMLLATGLKAFLMALALPIGQSTFAFAIRRFQNRGKIKPKRKPRTKTKKGRRSSAYSSRNMKLEEEEEAEWIRSQRSRKKKKGNQYWVSRNDVSVSKSDKTRSTSRFGGWDELDAGLESNVGSSIREDKKSSGSKGTPVEKGESIRDGPLLLRLLISIFPFLSSWTKVL